MRWPSAENRYGISQLYIEGDAAGKVIGRVSLYHIGTGVPDDLGYPIAEPAQGRGVATAAARRGGGRVRGWRNPGLCEGDLRQLAFDKELDISGREHIHKPGAAEKDNRAVLSRL